MSEQMPVKPDGLSLVLVALFRGVLYRDVNEEAWQYLLDLRPHVNEHSRLFGLDLVVDDAEGYAFLRHHSPGEGEPELPRLVRRSQLSFPVSLLLVLLRKKLLEHDAAGEETRLILSKDQIAEELTVFLPNTSNEARLLDRTVADLNRIADLGFLRRLRGQEDQYEVRRILKAFVDAQWLADLESLLEGYRSHAAEGSKEEAVDE